MASSSALRSGIKNYERYLNVLSGTDPYVAPALNAYDLLATEILTGSQASVTFSSLNSTYGADYQHLQVRMTSRSNQNDIGTWLRYRYNADSTGSNYYSHSLWGDGSSVSSQNFPGANGTGNGGTLYAASLALNSTANAFSGIILDILDPFETTKYTTMKAFYGLHGNYNRIVLTSSVWNNSAAITSFEILPDSGSFVSGTRVSLYGLKGV